MGPVLLEAIRQPLVLVHRSRPRVARCHRSDSPHTTDVTGNTEKEHTMRVFVAGASGAIGTRLVPQLIDQGHRVIGTFNSPGNAERVRALGAEPIALDLLDPRAVRKAVLETQPDAIVHQATALADVRFSRNLDRSFARTNRLRTEGTDALLAAAREAGVHRFVAQSFASMRYAREGGPVKTEDDPLDATPPAWARLTTAAMRYLDQAVTDAGGIALRYGGFYGASNDGLIEPVRKRQFPIVGSGDGVSSFIHLDDAAAATVLALEHDQAGIYNIVDDEPAPLREWLPVLANALGAKAFQRPTASRNRSRPGRDAARPHASRRPQLPRGRRQGAGAQPPGRRRHIGGYRALAYLAADDVGQAKVYGRRAPSTGTSGRPHCRARLVAGGGRAAVAASWISHCGGVSPSPQPQVSTARCQEDRQNPRRSEVRSGPLSVGRSSVGGHRSPA